MTIYYSCYSTETDYIGTMMWNCSCKVGIGVALVQVLHDPALSSEMPKLQQPVPRKNQLGAGLF